MSAIDRGDGTRDIIGIIRNISNRTFDGVQLVTQLFDKNNNLLDVQTIVPLPDTFDPNDDAPFKTSVNNSALDHYVIRVIGTSN